MAELSIPEWRTFLRARILQERGNDAEALQAFEQLLANNPDNPHLNASRAFALERLGRGQEALANRIAAKYAQLGHTLVGPQDQPEVWQSRLSELARELETTESKGSLAAAAMAW